MVFQKREIGAYLCGLSRLIGSTTSMKILHPFLNNFLDMAKEDIQFWISKFVADAKHKDGTPYPIPCTRYVCCGLGRGLNVIGHADDDIFNAPEFTLFPDTLDSCMKQLKVSGNF